MRRHVKHETSLEDRISERLDEIKTKAEALPPGSKERERLGGVDTSASIKRWLRE
jgi:hypothetical protein